MFLHKECIQTAADFELFLFTYYISVPECIPVIKRPMMIISGTPICLLKPMSPPATNTRNVLFTSVPLLHKNAERNNKNACLQFA